MREEIKTETAKPFWNPRADLRPNPRHIEVSHIDTVKTYSKATLWAVFVGEVVLVFVLGYHLYVSYADEPLSSFTLLTLTDIGVCSFLIYRLFRHGRETVRRLRNEFLERKRGA